tara:strand:- start:169 stop:321 length:153 start_codon:yes stop_codon:yes gene_type:complete
MSTIILQIEQPLFKTKSRTGSRSGSGSATGSAYLLLEAEAVRVEAEVLKI